MNLIFLTILLFVLRIISSTKIKLDKDRSLDNLLIFINDDVPEGDGSLLSNIKKYFTEASKSLLAATNNLDSQIGGVQLRYSYIRIPMSWKQKHNYLTTWQQCGNADIFISTIENNNNNKFDPFTKNSGNCGELGEFTKYPHEFFQYQNANNIRVKGNIIMNEFVKWRYGVFSEKPFRNMITYFDGYKFAKSTCGENIKLTLSKPPALCSIMDNDCTYSIVKGQGHLHSNMFDEETPTTSYFCDNATHAHNKLAKSLQNIKCNQRSISDVILQHSDFKNETKKTIYQDPFFFIVKGTLNRRIVLVIDTSGSMELKLDNVKYAAIEFIMNIVEDTAEVGLVTFNYNGEIKSKLLPMNNMVNKKILKTAINSLKPDGWTNIPDGLEKALNVFNTSLNSLDQISGTIILLTDGQNNKQTAAWDLMIPIQLEYKGVVLHSISYGRDSDRNLVKLAHVTGGRFIYADPKSSYSDLMSKLAIKTFCENPRKFSVKVLQENRTFSNVKFHEPFNLTYLDSYIGQNISITVTLNSNFDNDSIKLMNPKNDLFIPYKTVKEEAGITFSFKLSENPQFGMYKIILKSSVYKTVNESLFNNSDINMFYTISAIPDVTSGSIIPTGKLSKIDILQVDNFTSILVTIDMTTCQTSRFDKIYVNVSMTNPNNQVDEIMMNDNGVGGDSIEGDRVYSGVFYAKHLNVKGYYTFQGKVNILNGALQNPIQRTVEIDSLLVKESSYYPVFDKVSPAKINYFNIINSSSENKTLTISFLATGNDGLLGKISQYQINIYDDNNSTILTNTVEAEPLQKIFVDINLVNVSLNQIFSLTIRGVDNSNNYGEWSPVQIYSWDYLKIWNEYSKSGTSRISLPKYTFLLFGIFLMFSVIYF